MESFWKVSNMKYIVDNGFVNVISLLYTVESEICKDFGTYSLNIPYNGIEPGFIPYEDLTEQEVMDWCFQSMQPGEKETIEAETLEGYEKLKEITENTLNTIGGIPWQS